MVDDFHSSARLLNSIVLMLSEHRMASLSMSVGSSDVVSFAVRMTHMWQELILTERRSARFSADPW